MRVTYCDLKAAGGRADPSRCLDAFRRVFEERGWAVVDHRLDKPPRLRLTVVGPPGDPVAFVRVTAQKPLAPEHASAVGRWPPK